ncbi:D-alanyl-D-alanine carboxypeptidase family protein [Antrihabitans cavernicola]|uniref:Penicillin-binding protein n=1 Tax=Antrihabitans cavernicola TaxID=2495913 RepID=A0A5A7S973_9NOCA|nr:serine hydrolase [Spelaeibacter cavernicola]KAA0022690.1 penicillin-binding protein [Spelaeibacter cavernicola]
MSSRLLAVAAAVLIGLMSAPIATAQPTSGTSGTSSPATSTPFMTPDTDNCPSKTTPPKAIDSSEVPAPGESAPAPLPVPDPAVGGGKLGECGVITSDGAPALPKEISATSWVLSDLDTGQVLAAKDPHGRYRPASTIKILLSIVALRELDMNKVVIGTQEDADADGTRVGLGPGGQYSNIQLMHALVMASGNDAAHAISTQLGGEAATVQKMNDEAKSLGADDTRAATPAGLDGPGMSTSAYDLSLFFREALKNPTFADLIHTEQYELPGYPGQPPKDDAPTTTSSPGNSAASTTSNATPTTLPGLEIANDNQLLYDYDGALGGKTGYTDDARQTFVAGASRNGRRLAITLMKGDVLPIRPWEQAARLLDWGFALPRDESVGTLVDPGAATATAVPTVAAPPNAGAATLAAPAGDVKAESPFDRFLADHGRAIVLIVGSLLVLGLIAWAIKISGNNRGRHNHR